MSDALDKWLKAACSDGRCVQPVRPPYWEGWWDMCRCSNRALRGQVFCIAHMPVRGMPSLIRMEGEEDSSAAAKPRPL
jgi:hypothetical protein